MLRQTPFKNRGSYSGDIIRCENPSLALWAYLALSLIAQGKGPFRAQREVPWGPKGRSLNIMGLAAAKPPPTLRYIRSCTFYLVCVLISSTSFWIIFGRQNLTYSSCNFGSISVWAPDLISTYLFIIWINCWESLLSVLPAWHYRTSQTYDSTCEAHVSILGLPSPPPTLWFWCALVHVARLSYGYRVNHF